MENILEIQKKAFLKEGPPSLEQRTDLLKRCVALIETHQEKIIKANKTENDILSKCIKKAYDREDNNQQWAYWYRAWSEYLERTIQNAFKKQDWSVFKIYYKILKLPKIRAHYKKYGAVKENIFEL